MEVRILVDISKVTPSNVADSFAFLQAPNRFQFWKPLGWETNQALIDTYSDYVVCSDTSHGIVAFERPGVWQDGTVAVCFTNLVKITALTITESATGTIERISEQKELKIERYPFEKFKELFKE
jgi:hypothetical protein